MTRPLRKTVVFLTLVVTAACGGGGDTPTPTGVTGPDDAGQHTAASISVVTGDNQAVGAGAAVPTAPVVRAMSERGRPLRGASLTLTAEAGRGALNATSVVTNDAGEATLPRWVAPLTVGEFAVSVSAAGQSGAQVTARVVARVADGPQTVVTQSIGTGGGTVAVTADGSPIKGLTITVPPGALSSATTFTVSTQPAPTLPASVTLAGPAIVIAGPTTLSDSIMTVRVPASVTTGAGKLRVFVMTAENALIPVPNVATDANSATIQFRAFVAPSENVTVSSLRLSGVTTSVPGPVTFVLTRWVAPASGVFTTNFLPGRDNAGFSNRGSFWEGGNGYCAGSTVFSGAWFRRGGAQLTMRAQFPSLLSQAQLGGWPLTDQLNPAIRAASALTLRYAWGTNTVGWWKTRFGEDPETVWDNVLFQIAVGDKPVYVRIRSADNQYGHAILAYSVDVNLERIYVADPNFPQLVRYLQYHSSTQSFDAFPSSPTAGAQQVTFANFSDATYLFLEDAPIISAIINKYLADGYRTEFPPVTGHVKLANSVVTVSQNTTSFSVQPQDSVLRFVASDLGVGRIDYTVLESYHSDSMGINSNQDTLRIPLVPGLNSIAMVFFATTPTKPLTWYDTKLLRVTKPEQFWNLAPIPGPLTDSFDNNLAVGSGTLTINFPPTIKTGEQVTLTATLSVTMTYRPNIVVNNEGLYLGIGVLGFTGAYKETLFGAGPPGRSIAASVTATGVWTVPATAPGSAAGIGRFDVQIRGGFMAGSGVGQFGFVIDPRYNQVP